MPAIPQDLIDESECFICLGISLEESTRLAELARVLSGLVPTADTSTTALLAYGNCFACYGVSQFEIMELALTAQIAAAS